MTTTTTTTILIVTDEQIDRCTRYVDEKTKEAFYQVESESTSDIYTVRWNAKTRRFTCTCASGQEAFLHSNQAVNINGQTTCKHCRWSIAAGKAYHAAIKAEAAAKARKVATNVDAETLERVLNAKPSTPSKKEVERDARRYAPRAFSLMR